MADKILKTRYFKTLMVVFFSVISLQVFAADKGYLTYQGRIVKSDGNPLESASVVFTLKIYNPTNTCLLWQETKTVNMEKSSGVFSLVIGSSSNQVSGGASAVATVFSNDAALTGQSSCSYTPVASDDRNLVVSFTDGSITQTLSTMSIKSVPYAMYADKAGEAAKVGGAEISQTAPANGQALIYNSTTQKWEPQTLGGGGTITGVTAGTGLTGGGTSGTVSLSVDTGTSAGKIPVLDGSAKIPIALLPNIPVDQISNGAGKYFTYQPNNTACNTNEFLQWDGSKWVCGTAGGGSVTSVTASAPLSSTGGSTPQISLGTVGYDKGGTGLTATSQGALLIGSGTTSWTTVTCALNEILQWGAAGSTSCIGANGLNGFVKLDGAGKLPTLDGSALTNLPAQLPSQTGNSGKFLTTDGSNASWGTVSGDNLGNHAATSNIILGSNWLSGDGGNEGISVDASGNVGIGTTAPPNKLSIQNATSGAYTHYYSGGSTSLVGSVGNGTGIYSSNIIDFYSGQGAPHPSDGQVPNPNFLRMRITNAGNVGIGTNSPLNTLSVYKANSTATLSVTSDNTSSTTDRYPSLSIINYDGNTTTGSVGTPTLNLTNYRGNSSTTAVMKSGDPLGSVLFNGSSDASGNYKEGAGVWAFASQDFSNTASGTELHFYTTQNNTTTGAAKMVIDNAGNVGVGATAPNSKLQVAGAISTAISNKTTAYTVTANDSVITANATSGTFAVTLPTAVGITGRQYTIKKTDSSANAVTISTTSSQTIDGAASATLSTQYQYLTLISDGANWSVIGGTATSLFQRITAVVTTSAGTSAVTSCPGGYTLIDWHMHGHAGPAYDSGSGWNYCTCNQSGNGITATLNINNSNANFHCSCSGLCSKN